MARVWFITATSRGLGRALVEAVLESGHNVIATARNPDSIKSFVDKYGSDRVYTAALDVTDSDQVFRVVEESHQVFGRIDVVVNNAGYAGTASVEDTSVDSFRRQMDTNFFGTVWVTKAVIPILRKQGSGHVIQISSAGGRLATPGLGAYQSAKWAVGGLAGVLAVELAPLGVKFTVLEPGSIMTDWAGSSMEVGEISEPYKQTVGQFLEFRDYLTKNGTPPEKMAKAIVQISKVEDPPLRLLMGPEVPPRVKQAVKELAESDAKWEQFSNTLEL